MSKGVFLVIMAGGSGTRFWPKSTAARPKQLLSFGDSETLIRKTLGRFDGLVARDTDHRFIVTTQKLRAAIVEQVGSSEVATLAEPQGRNTAPCVYWAAREVAKRDPKGVMLVMPSDHYIPRLEDFRRTLGRAIDWARMHDDLVTLGVKPTRPETGYGYLQVGEPLEAGAGKKPGAGGSGGFGEDCHRVSAFVEKPNVERAREFLAKGNYLWNGGMFAWRAEVVLRAFDAFMPEMREAWEAAGGDVERAYPKMTATSVDFGIMERAKNVVTFGLDCGWDDLGAWTSLESIADDLNARVECGVLTGGRVVSADARGNIVDAPGKLVALLGVDDLIVVEHGDSILVARKDRAQGIKQIVDQLKTKYPEKL